MSNASMTNTDMELSVDIDAPAETAWRAIIDWPRQGEWLSGTKVGVTEGDGRGIGSRIAVVTSFFGVGVTDPMEIVVWEPPVRCTLRHLGKVVQGTASFEVRERGEGRSTLVWTEHREIPLGVVGRLWWSAAHRGFIAGLQRSLNQFAPFAESYDQNTGKH